MSNHLQDDAKHVRSVLQRLRAMPEPGAALENEARRLDPEERHPLFLLCREVLGWWNEAKLKIIQLQSQLSRSSAPVAELQERIVELEDLVAEKDAEIAELKKWIQEVHEAS